MVDVPKRPPSVPRLAARSGLLALLSLALVATAAAQEQEVESPAAATLSITSASPSAATHFWTGMDEWLNIDPPVAAEHFEMAVAADPELGIARAMSAWATPGLSSEVRAAGIRQAMASMADATSAENLIVLAVREIQMGNQASGVAMLKTAAKIVQDDPYVAFISAWMQGSNVKDMKALTKQFPEFAPAWNTLAYAAWNQEGDKTLAMKAVQRYAELRPDHPNPHDSHAEMLQWSGKLEEARAAYQRAVELRPTFGQAYYGLAEVHWLMGDAKGARAQIEKGIEHAPTDAAKAWGRLALANTYVMEGKRKEAVQSLEAIAAEAEQREMKGLATTAHQQLAAVDAVLGKGQSIETHLAKAAAIGGEDSPAQTSWAAYSYAMAGNMEASQAALGRLSAKGQDAPARELKALQLIKSAQPEAALKELEKADADDYFVRTLKAECHKNMKQTAEFKKMRDALLADPALNFFDSASAMARLHAKRL